MKCVNCGNETQSGKTYPFYYGKKGETVFPTHKTSFTHYSIAGQEDAFLCDECVDAKIEHRARMTAIYAFAGTLLLALLRLLLDPYAAPDAPAMEKVLGFPMAFSIALILYFGIRRWKNGKQREDEGQRLAIKARNPTLLGQGFDAFFTQSEYSRLG